MCICITMTSICLLSAHYSVVIIENVVHCKFTSSWSLGSLWGSLHLHVILVTSHMRSLAVSHTNQYIHISHTYTVYYHTLQDSIITHVQFTKYMHYYVIDYTIHYSNKYYITVTTVYYRMHHNSLRISHTKQFIITHW